MPHLATSFATISDSTKHAMTTDGKPHTEYCTCIHVTLSTVDYCLSARIDSYLVANPGISMCLQ